MLVDEKFTYDGGENDLFHNLVNKLDFLTEENAKILSTYWLKRYGSLPLFSNYELVKVADIANIVALVFSNNWLIMNDQLKQNLLGTGKVITVKEGIDRTENNTRQNDNTTTNKQSGYNETEMQDNTQTIESSTDTDTGTVNRNRDYTRTENWTDTVNLTKDYLTLLQNNRIYDKMIADVNSMLTTYILGGI